MHRIPATDEHITRAAQHLKNAGLVAMPTETVYGLACDATNPTAIAKVFHAKARPHFDPLILHVASIQQAQRWTSRWPEHAANLTKKFWPGPLTLVLPRHPDVPDLITAGLDTVAIRMPDHPVARSLLEQAGVPLAAPSANRFGSISPTTAQHVLTELAGHTDETDLILDAGPTTRGLESTVLLLAGETPTLLRPGALPIDAIEHVIGPIQRKAPTSNPGQAQTQPQTAPGMLDRHYAPRTPMHLVQTIPCPLEHGDAVLNLPRDGIAAAAQLYARLRELDADPSVHRIFATPHTDPALGPAINDRLTRASTKAQA